MKKIILAVSLATAMAASSYAQGLVFFASSTQNTSTNNTLAQLGNTASGRIAGVGNFYFALFYSATATTVGGTQTGAIQGTNGVYAWSDSNWTMIGSTIATNTASAGRFAAAVPNADGSTTIPTVASGSTAQFLVIGWSSNLGGSIAALQNALTTPGMAGFLGESEVSGSIALGNGGSNPTPQLFGAALPNLQGFTLGSFAVASTPEPGTLALAALGGASLLAFRRKK
jgi:hypothetical protein